MAHTPQICHSDSGPLRSPGGDRQQIVYRHVKDLKINPKNPRAHSKKQIRQLAESIRIFGFNGAIIVDRDLNLIAGHARFLGCKLLGFTDVPTIMVEHLTPAQIRAFMIADNRLSENATWNEQLLAEQFKELSEVELDFALEVTGFDMGEIDVRIEGLESGTDSEHDAADNVPEQAAASQVSRKGDLWLLDRHRVLCGDALKEDAFAVLMEGCKAAAVFVDPPYNVPIDGHVSGKGKIRHRDFAMASGEMTVAEFTDFLTQSLSLLASHSGAGSLHYVCMDWRHVGEVLAAGLRAYSYIKNLCVWVKDNGGMGSLYRSQHELIFVFKSGDAPHRNNIQLGQFGRNRTNVWSYPGVNSFSRSGGEGNLLALHPTVKPVALVADAIMDCSARGEVVLDSFLGSGTTVIGAERTGRTCYGIEISPIYVDTIVRRWQAFTGRVAVHAESGRSFDELQEEAANVG
jgi:DNA modification methylase